jgi:hypothetical protein
MRIPFLQRIPLPELDKHPIPPLVTPKFEYTPSDTLQIILHIPANGFIQLQPPLNPTDEELPGEYDHILNGEVELIAPDGYTDTCVKIRVGVRVSSKLVFGKKVEESVLFERTVELSEGLDLSPGSQQLALAVLG